MGEILKIFKFYVFSYCTAIDSGDNLGSNNRAIDSGDNLGSNNRAIDSGTWVRCHTYSSANPSPATLNSGASTRSDGQSEVPATYIAPGPGRMVSFL
jgi:hypothetical protein